MLGRVMRPEPGRATTISATNKDFLSENGKLWPMVAQVAIATGTVANMRPRRSDELLATVYVVGRAGQRGVGHEVDGQRGDVRRADDAADRERFP